MNKLRKIKKLLMLFEILAILLLANSMLVNAETVNAEVHKPNVEAFNTTVVDTRAIDADVARTTTVTETSSIGIMAPASISSCTVISSPGTYILNADVIGSTADTCIAITSSDVTLDGNGHKVDGTSRWTTFGVFIHNPDTALTNVNVKNLKVTNWSYGIYYKATVLGTISNNNASSNNYGYFFDTYAGRNKLIGNTADSNQDGFHIKSGYNTLDNNKADTNSYGFVIDQTSNNILTNNNASSNYQGYQLRYTQRNTLNKNTANYDSNGYGYNIYASGNNTLTNNSASQYYGFMVQSSDHNVLAGNNANGSNYGFYLSYSTNNTIKGNTASKDYGIYLSSSDNNTISRNTVAQDSQYGIAVYYSNNNTTYDNIFNNTNNYYLYSSTNMWNINQKPLINIVNGLYIAGNVWENPTKTGFSQICGDVERNGICDPAYPLDGSNIDYLPLVHHPDKTIPKSVTNLVNTSYAYNYIKWTWNDPTDIDFSYVKIYIDGNFKRGVLNGVQSYNATGFLPNTSHTIGTKTVDINGNENATMRTSTAWTRPDTSPPASITGLGNTTYARTYINWTWTDPIDSDFAKVKVYINSIWRADISKGKQFYNDTGLTNNTLYTIGTHTVDITGNINQTWVNRTEKTAP